MTEKASFRGVFTDIMLWLVLGTLMGVAVYYAVVNLPQQHRQVLTLTFRDANEMTRGANVRMMGVDIGYVDDIWVQEDEVDVVIRTMPDAPKIPPGSLATIQFTGLVGSKSIEIIPADPSIRRATADGQYLNVEEPIRLKDYFDYNIEIAEALRMGAENLSDFFGKRKPVEELQHNIRTGERATANAGMHLQNGLDRMADFRGKYAKSSADFLTFMAHFRLTTDHAVWMLDPNVFAPSVAAVLHYGEALFSEGSAAFGRFQGKKGYLDAESHIGKGQCRIRQACEQVASLDLKGRATGMHGGISRFHEAVVRADQFFQADHNATLRVIRGGIQTFNGQIRRLLEYL